MEECLNDLQVRLEFRDMDLEESSSERNVSLTVMKEEVDGDLVNVIIELCEEADLFSLMETQISRQQFMKLQVENRYNFTFEDLPNVLGSIFKEHNSSTSDLSIAFYKQEQKGTLEISQILDFSVALLFSLEFKEITGKEAFEKAQMRFHRTRMELFKKESEIDAFMKVIAMEDPSLKKILIN